VSTSTDKAVLPPAGAGYLPEFCHMRTLFGVVLLAELLALVIVLAAHPWAFWDHLGLTSLFVQWVAISSAALLCLLRRPLGRLPAFRSTAASYLVVLATAAMVSEIAYRVSDDLGVAATLGTHTGFLGRNLAITAIVGAVALRFFYLQHLHQVHLQAENQARIQALQARIRPHFLFNSMNTIAALIRTRPEQAETAVEDLADLFRASLADAGKRVALGEELEFARRYLEIEALRLGDRLRVRWEVETLPRDLRVPPLILQPLLENAIYHGIERRVDGGELVITGRVDAGGLSIEIRNPGALTGSSPREGRGLALDNIRERLALSFGPGAGVELEQGEEECRVRLRIPARAMA